MGQHGPQKPPKTIQNPTKPHKTNPFQSFPSIPPPAPFTSLLPKQQNRNYSWGMWPLNHTWKITPLANKEPASPNMGRRGPQNHPKPTKPHKTNPFQSFPSIPPPAPFTSLLPKQQNRNYSWGMWPLNHTWKITPLANKEPASPNMGRRGPQNPTSSCILLSALFFQCFPSFSWWISWNYSKATLGREFQYYSWYLEVPPLPTLVSYYS